MALHNRDRHSFSRGRDFACKVGCGLFRLGVAHREKQEYSSYAKASLYQIFCSEGEEQRVEAFACGSFYLLSCLYLLLLSFFSCGLRLIGPFNCTELLLDNKILHIFILHAQVIKMDVTPSSHN